MSLELRLATRVFIEESSLDRLLNEALRLSISDSWFTSLQWGQKKLSPGLGGMYTVHRISMSYIGTKII